ncbi:MAG: hypothetical protein HY924_11420 [Elusimicrobia bacterium]|nr:hypothetical protein [Elusimicrobiota bacterium]
MPKNSQPKRKKDQRSQETGGGKGITGKYVYDPKLGRVVKVSDRIPKVASAGKKTFACGADSSSESLPCGEGGCGGGSCGLGGMGL